MPRLTETIMKSSQVSRIIISASIVAAVGFLTYSWAVSPQASYLQAAQQYELVSQDVNKKVKITSNQVRVKEIKLEELKVQLKASGVSFFSTAKAADFFAGIGKTVTASGCNIESMVFDRELTTKLDNNNPQSPKVTEKKALVKVTGSYGEIVKLISAFEDYPLAVYVSDLLIRSTSNSTDKLLCSMNLKVYLTEDKDLLLDK